MLNTTTNTSKHTGKVCVISQPTFLPWLGWFDLVDQGDVMVILDDVAFSKQSWQQRNRIRTPNGLDFLTLPVKSSGRFGQRIDECELAGTHFVRKMLASIRGNYSRAPGFSTTFEELSEVFGRAAESQRLVELNCTLIEWMAKKLDIATPLLRSSALGQAGERGEHVAAICESLGANAYLSPAGAEDYLIEDQAAFQRRGIEILIHVFDHPEYPQCFSPFISHASAIDLIFNAGSAAPEIMRSGRRPARGLRQAETDHQLEQERENR